MGIFLQNNLFPFQQNLDMMGAKTGMGSRMPNWARKQAMSAFQPVPSPKKKKKDEKEDRKAAGLKTSGKKKAKKGKAEKESPEKEGPEKESLGKDNLEKESPGQETAEANKAGKERAGNSPAESSPAEVRQPTSLYRGAAQTDLHAAVVWAEILGEPVARKRRRRRVGMRAGGK